MFSAIFQNLGIIFFLFLPLKIHVCSHSLCIISILFFPFGIIFECFIISYSLQNRISMELLSGEHKVSQANKDQIESLPLSTWKSHGWHMSFRIAFKSQSHHSNLDGLGQEILCLWILVSCPSVGRISLCVSQWCRRSRGVDAREFSA